LRSAHLEVVDVDEEGGRHEDDPGGGVALRLRDVGLPQQREAPAHGDAGHAHPDHVAVVQHADVRVLPGGARCTVTVTVTGKRDGGRESDGDREKERRERERWGQREGARATGTERGREGMGWDETQGLRV